MKAVVVIWIVAILAAFAAFDTSEQHAAPPYDFGKMAEWKGVPDGRIELAVSAKPAGVECKDGKCSIVRRYEQPKAMTVIGDETVSQPTATTVEHDNEYRFNGPVARAGRAIGWRMTHPFRGMFRR